MAELEPDNSKNTNKTSVHYKNSKILKDDKKPFETNIYVSSAGYLVLYFLLYVMYCCLTETEDAILAKQHHIYVDREEILKCDPEYLKDVSKYSGCRPKHCGRHVSDTIVSPEEVNVILKFSMKAMDKGGSFGASTFLDFHTGAVSFKETYINIYSTDEPFKLTQDELDNYKNVRLKVRQAVAKTFGIDEEILHFTFPSFFVRIDNNTSATSLEDKYWHVHVDKVTYPSFHYTSVLYFSDYGIDFKGGRLLFANEEDHPKYNYSVEPRKARIAFFTSGTENPYYVEKVTEGIRFALGIPFSCDPDKKLNEPDNKKNSYKYLQEHFNKTI